MIAKVKERIRKTMQRTSNRIGSRIEHVKMRASHLLVKTVWRQLRKSHQPATWLKAQAREGLHQLRSCARTVWGKHCDQVQNNPSYATALAAMVTTLAELAIHDASALSVLAAGIAIYLAVHRASSTNPYRRDSDGWGDTPYWR
jgi:hypothetical protein